MKRLTLLILGIFILSACENSNNSTTSDQLPINPDGVLLQLYDTESGEPISACDTEVTITDQYAFVFGPWVADGSCQEDKVSIALSIPSGGPFRVSVLKSGYVQWEIDGIIIDGEIVTVEVFLGKDE